MWDTGLGGLENVVSKKYSKIIMMIITLLWDKAKILIAETGLTNYLGTSVYKHSGARSP